VTTPAPPSLWIPAVTCPSCGARPALRIVAKLRALVVTLRLRDDVELLSFQCRVRTCGTVYPITAGAVRDARPHPARLAPSRGAP
jgi:hypothetical protein